MSALLRADWPAPPGVHAFTTLRHGAGGSRAPFDTFNLGNRYMADGDDAAVVEANRAALARLAALPSTPRWMRQVHGTEVLRFTPATTDRRADIPVGAPHGRDALASDPGQRPAPTLEPTADAAVTAHPGVVLAILTADCLPVLLASRDGGEIGAAHAGWRGLADGVLENTVATLRARPGDLVAWLGPAAGPGAYEVGEEVHEAFVGRDARAATAFVPTRPGHWRVDLYALARQRLADAGVTEVHGGTLCTISDPRRFYSHRRDARTGRMATLAWIAPRADSAHPASP